jgi:hypothetical protein
MTMDKFLHEVIAAPDDDAARQAYAAAFRPADPARSRFIDLQLQAAQAERAGRVTASFRPWEDAADELLAANRPAWVAGLCPPCGAAYFVRGFVEHVQLSMAAFLDHGAALLALAPIRHLDLTPSPGRFAEVLASPLLARLRSLKLDRCGLADDQVEGLAASPHLGELQWLELMRNQVDMGGARALAASQTLPKLRYVGFFGNRVDPSEELFFDQGVVIDRSLPEAGHLLEQEFGHLPWLHFDASTNWDVPPRRY